MKINNKKEDLNKSKPHIKKIMEIIKEDQFRVYIVIVYLGFIITILKLFFEMNPILNFNSIIKNYWNYLIIFLSFIVIKNIQPLVNEICTQTNIRDSIEKQKEIKLELENLKLMKELGLQYNDKKLSENIKDLLKKN